MFPLRDHNSSHKLPIVTWSLIAINIILFIIEVTSPDINAFISKWALVPAFVDFTNPSSLLPFFTSMFLHAGLWHIVSNMWFLMIFGDNIEATLGRIRYLGFYIAGGLIAAFVEYLSISNSAIPILGASGAIAAVLGYYLIAFPHNRVDTLIVFIYIRIISLPAQIVLGLWFVLQLFNGTSTLISSSTSSGVAWWAHIGGFVFGMLIAKLNEEKRQHLTHVRY